jgi:hypothetical protein
MSDGFLHRYFLNNGDKKIHKWIHYFDMYEPNLNNNVPGQTQDQSKLQYRTKNRLEIIEKVRNWQRENKERFNKYQREYKQNKKNIIISPISINVIEAVY